MTTQVATPTTMHDICIAHNELGKIKKPTPREKAAYKKLSDAMCHYAEGLRPINFVPAKPETE